MESAGNEDETVAETNGAGRSDALDEEVRGIVVGLDSAAVDSL